MLHEGATKGNRGHYGRVRAERAGVRQREAAALIGGKQLVDLLAQYGIGQYTVQ
jgi:hypothetical protein